jgi:hypothetical protein
MKDVRGQAKREREFYRREEARRKAKAKEVAQSPRRQPALQTNNNSEATK